jgi:small-conductance mechanosensitive channel
LGSTDVPEPPARTGIGLSPLQRGIAAALVALLVATAWGLWATDEPPAPARVTVSTGATAADNLPVIDQSTLLTAQRLARLATTPEERPLAEAAVQLADHELDLAFSGALRHIEAHPPVLSADAQHIQDRLDQAQKQLAIDKETVGRLQAQLAAAAEADKPAIQDQLDLLQSQVDLEEDEVAEADHDLLQAGGNVHQLIQIAQQEHLNAQKNATAAPAPPPGAFAVLHGMFGQAREWLALHRKRTQLRAAGEHAAVSAAQLAAERVQLAAEVEATKQSIPQLSPQARQAAAGSAPPPARMPVAAGPAAGVNPPTTLLGATRRLAADQRRLTLRDQRVSARKKLAAVYAQWDGVVAGQQREVLHDCLQSAAIVLTALLLLLFADRWLGGLLGRAHIERRQAQTLRSVIGVALQVVGVLLILFVLVGVPGQLGTMLGIAGAGLTVALKDFIVAFIGWFVLMGRNGMRLGDWVEINGVSGEVVELGMFHTVLLETGNWTDTGHPTGRHVTFTNSFAIEGHYFNFSTSGQWLWDELTVVVPYGRDAHAIADAIQKEVVAATKDSTAQAEREWQRASHGQRGSALSSEPGVAVRPISGGVEIAVRYVTRASERYALRAKLYQSAVQLLAETATPG